MSAKSNPMSDSTEHRLVITREFDAPRELVWQAWTEPYRMQQWLGLGDGVTIESVLMDVGVGGKFRLQQRMSDGEYYTAAGTYLEVTTPEKLVYTWDWETDGAGTEYGELEGKETLVTVEFHDKGKRTELVLTHEKFTTEKSRDGHQAGWTSWLERMDTFLKG